MSQNHLRRLLSSPLFSPFLILLLLWFDFVWVVRREWTYNDQYSYGWFTLGLLIYLLYIRISDRPKPAAGNIHLTRFIFLGVVILSLNRIVIGSNPEWRPTLWLHVLTIFGMTLAMLWSLGGRSWIRHFAPTFTLMLFAVPWPTFLESSVTGGLMRMVAAIVVDSMNLIGIYAEQSGNLIRLRSGWVGIEAACSGVRNFQSTLMSAWFVGELFRFTWLGRGLLLFLSGIASLLLNVGRTWILTWSTHRSGASLTETIHDPVGYTVSVIAFLILIVIAFLLRKYFARESSEREGSQAWTGQSSELSPQRRLSHPVCFSAIAILIAGYGVAELWYYRVERSFPDPQAIEVDWQNLAHDVEFVDINPAIRGQLKYSDGFQAEWVDTKSRAEWKVFFFSWTNGTVSPFIGVHNPETCLPASGFRKGKTHTPLIFEVDAQQIEFQVTTFYFMERPYQVYYATWNDYWGPAVPFVETTSERFELAWSGRRLTNRRSLQIVIEGISNEAITRQNVENFLDKTLAWENSNPG